MENFDVWQFICPTYWILLIGLSRLYFMNFSLKASPITKAHITLVIGAVLAVVYGLVEVAWFKEAEFNSAYILKMACNFALGTSMYELLAKKLMDKFK